jgi:cell division protein FtsZ
MTLHLTVPQQKHTDFTPRITVIGVGGGGTNAVDNMIALELQGVDFIVANTDAQQLTHSRASHRIQLGPNLTGGLGAGAKPSVGQSAAEEAAEEIARALESTHMVFITAGMGGGTGTGAAPVIARMAKERGILTVGVVTRPFSFEGARRARVAEEGIAELQKHVDTLIIIPNQNLFRLANERTTWKEAFKMADNVLYMGVRGVTDLMLAPGLINLDFADIRTVMAEMGKAMMGTGEAEGEGRAIRAAEAAISNPLLEDTSMEGARGLLINITGGEDLTLFEVDQAATRIKEEVDENANIIFGSAIDPELNGRIRVSVVATGIHAAEEAQLAPPLKVVAGGRAEPVAGGAAATPVAARPIPPVALVPTPAPMEAIQAAPTTPEPLEATDTPQAMPRDAAAPAEPPVRGPVRPRQAPPQPAPNLFTAPDSPAPVNLAFAPPPASQPQPGNSLFTRMTGLFRGKPHAAERTHATEPAAPAAEPAPEEPRAAPRAEPRATLRPSGGDDMMDIPAFLRRHT